MLPGHGAAPPQAAMQAQRSGLGCYGCLCFLDRTGKAPRGAPQNGEHARTAAKEAAQPLAEAAAPALAQSPSRKELTTMPSQAQLAKDSPEVKLLNQYADMKKAYDHAGCCELLAESAVWRTLYSEEVAGRSAIEEWMQREASMGRRNHNEEPWVMSEVEPLKFKRGMKVTFPSKATHEVVQTATVQDGQITHIEMKAKYPALSCAIAFAQARASQDDDAALAQMSESIVWKAWDGHEVRGKDAVRRLFREQKGREVKRSGTSEFEAAQVNEAGGCFERELMIERVDGIKVKTKQQLYVMGELGEKAPVDIREGNRRQCWGMVPKIVQVRVLTTEELVDGVWVKCESVET